MKHFVLSLSLSLCSLLSVAQLSVTDSISAEVLTEWLEGENLSIENIMVNCLGGAIGTFTYTGADLPMTEGVIMASGFVTEAIGPNVSDNTSGIMSSPYVDADMDVLTGGTSQDVCAIEFDCTPDFSYLLFDYVFGSEEYPEFVNSFNDGFAFLVSGPGITGLYSSPSGFPGGSENFCMVPDTDLPVTINNVNNGSNSCSQGGPQGPCMNCDYYVDNCGGTDLAFDGLTTLLPGALPVEPGSTYHVKIAIADALDFAFDSGVFIQKQSFRSANILSLSEGNIPPGLSLFPNPSIDELILNGLEEGFYLFTILDMKGQLVHRESGMVSGDMYMDVSSLAQGPYLLRVQVANGSSFIIEFQKD